MKIFAISVNSFREYIRNRLVYVCLFIAAILLAISVFLGSLSFTEQQRILVHFGFSAIHLTSLIVVCFLGSFVMSKEIERQTCLLVLARPLGRGEFLLGKWLGVHWLVVLLNLTLLSVLLILLEFKIPTLSLLQMGLGVYFEMTILLSLTFFLSSFLGAPIALFSSVGLFLTGNWLDELDFFAKKMGSEVFVILAKYIKFFVPNLYRMNWRSIQYADTGVPSEMMTWAFFHAVGWSGLLLIAAIIVFRRKDLV